VTATVVPTKATVELARAMIAEAKRQESGAEAVILHYDDCQPEQVPALVGLLLEAAKEPRVAIQQVVCSKCVRPCAECGLEKRITARGMCSACYQRILITPRRRQIVCVDCGETRRAKSRDRCTKCYQRARRKGLRDTIENDEESAA